MFNLSLGRELPRLPTVSWRRGQWDSKTHYDGDKGRTLCGCKIPRDIGSLESGDGEQCEACATILASGSYLRRGPARRARRQPVRHSAPASRWPSYFTAEDIQLAEESRRM